MSWLKCRAWLMCSLMLVAAGCTESTMTKNGTNNSAEPDVVSDTTSADVVDDTTSADVVSDTSNADVDSDSDTGVNAQSDVAVAPNCVEDQCGVCDDDITNDCVQDCNGDWGGSAALDNCGVCDSDLSNDCIQDCAGTYGGSAMPDNCGVCDDDPTNDCVEDCDGTWGGNAAEDACGTCDADPSNDCVPECNGAGVVNECGVCDNEATEPCVQDCAGVWGGDSVEDQCGTCDSDSANDCVQDCNGDWGGDASLDACGRCVGGNSGASACPTVTLTPEADASVNTSTTTLGDEENLVIENGSNSVVYLRFDLSELPSNAAIQGVKLQAHAYSGLAHGGDGNVYTHFVGDDSWDEYAINGSNAPSEDPNRLGHWWLWYDNTPSDKIGINSSPALAVVAQREYNGDRKLSLMLNSSGYDTNYRSREYADATQHPKLVVGYLIASTTELEPSADAWVAKNGGQNNGDDESLEVAQNLNAQTFLHFDLNSLPSGAVITKATLTMTAYKGLAYGGNGNVYTRLVSDDSWTENAITGDNAPPAADDDLGYWWLWYNNTASIKIGTFSTPELRDAVQSEYNGDKKISLRLHSAGYDTSYRSREWSDPDARPKLSVEYVIP